MNEWHCMVRMANGVTQKLYRRPNSSTHFDAALCGAMIPFLHLSIMNVLDLTRDVDALPNVAALVIWCD